MTHDAAHSILARIDQLSGAINLLSPRDRQESLAALRVEISNLFGASSDIVAKDASEAPRIQVAFRGSYVEFVNQALGHDADFVAHARTIGVPQAALTRSVGITAEIETADGALSQDELLQSSLVGFKILTDLCGGVRVAIDVLRQSSPEGTP